MNYQSSDYQAGLRAGYKDRMAGRGNRLATDTPKTGYGKGYLRGWQQAARELGHKVLLGGS